MFLFIPIGREDVLRKPPIATVGLISLNILFFLVTYPMEFSFRTGPLAEAARRFGEAACAPEVGLLDKWRKPLAEELSRADFPSARALMAVEAAGDEVTTNPRYLRLMPSELDFPAFMGWFKAYGVEKSVDRILLGKMGSVLLSRKNRLYTEYRLDLKKFAQVTPQQTLKGINAVLQEPKLRKLADPDRMAEDVGVASWDPPSLRKRLSPRFETMALNRRILFSYYGQEGGFLIRSPAGMRELHADYLATKQQHIRAGKPVSSVYARLGYRPQGPALPGLLTYQFMHAGWVHLLANMLLLWIVGCNIEERWGPPFLVLIYLGGGCMAALAEGRLGNLGEVSLVGASGSIAAVMGAFLVRSFNTGIRFFYAVWLLVFVRKGQVVLPAWFVLIVWFAFQVLLGLASKVQRHSNVAYWTHAGGFASGVLAGLYIMRSKAASKWEREAEETGVSLDIKLETASQEFDQGNFQETLRLCGEVLQAAPRNLEAYAGLLCAYERMGQLKLCGPLAARMLGYALGASRAELAAKIYKKWKKVLSPDTLTLNERLNFAQALEKMALWQDAFWYYRSAINVVESESISGTALYRCGKVLKDRLGKGREAEDYFKLLLDRPYDLEWGALAKAELEARSDPRGPRPSP